VELKRFDGGRYAVTRCVVRGDPLAEIPAAWGHLAEWVRGHGRKLGPHQSLEMHVDPEAAESSLVIDLYCPVA
jgi:DNA gyrase inhibitor GyrI